MPRWIYAEANLFAIAVLTILIISMNKKDARHVTALRLYLFLVLSCMLTLALDTGCVLVEGLPGGGFRTLQSILNTFRYCAYPVPCFLWFLYATYQIHHDEERIKKRIAPILLPLLINAALSVGSLFDGLIFSIDGNNGYHVGPGMPILMGIGYIYIAASIIQLVRSRKEMERRTLISFLLLPLLPSAGGVAQYFYPGMPIVWMASSVMLLMIFLHIQSEQLYTDYLTGLYNRKELAIFLDECVRVCSASRLFSGVMIDLDNLKAVNDTYGHAEGDRAIVTAAQILRQSIDESAFAARFAGDEFIVIQKSGAEALRATLETIRRNVRLFNDKRLLPYEISLSFGYEQLDLQRWPSSRDFINHIDTMMYKEKRNKTIKEADTDAF